MRFQLISDTHGKLEIINAVAAMIVSLLPMPRMCSTTAFSIFWALSDLLGQDVQHRPQWGYNGERI